MGRRGGANLTLGGPAGKCSRGGQESGYLFPAQSRILSVPFIGFVVGENPLSVFDGFLAGVERRALDHRAVENGLPSFPVLTLPALRARPWWFRMLHDQHQSSGSGPWR